MSTETDPVPPLPQHTPPIDKTAGALERFENNWMQWFIQLRTKINIINASLVNLGKLAGLGFPALDGVVWNARTLTAGIGIGITNGDGVAGNPVIFTHIQVIRQKSDFPTPAGGVITLANNVTYLIITNIDLTGDRLVGGTNSGLFGLSADNCGIVSTGLIGTAMITSTSSLPMQNLTLSADVLFNLNDAMGSLEWFSIRIVNTPTVGTLQSYSNIVWTNCVLVNSANLTFTGSCDSIAFTTCLFVGRPAQTTITVSSAAVISRRFRLLYSALTVGVGETGINFSASATIPTESYILDNTAFSGSGTFITGLDHTSNKSLFFNNTGITNTSALAQYSMTGNATATVIAVAGTFVKVAGTTVAGALIQKFDLATTNRALYVGASTSNFRITAFASMSSGNNQTLRMRIALNGVTLSDSTATFKTTGSGEASSVGNQTFITMAPNDFVEVFVTNDTAANNIIVSDLNLTIARLV